MRASTLQIKLTDITRFASYLPRFVVVYNSIFRPAGSSGISRTLGRLSKVDEVGGVGLIKSKETEDPLECADASRDVTMDMPAM